MSCPGSGRRGTLRGGGPTRRGWLFANMGYDFGPNVHVYQILLAAPMEDWPPQAFYSAHGQVHRGAPGAGPDPLVMHSTRHSGLPPAGSCGDDLLRLRSRRVLEPEAGSGDLRIGRLPLHRRKPAFRPRRHRSVPQAVLEGAGGPSPRDHGVCLGDGLQGPGGSAAGRARHPGLRRQAHGAWLEGRRAAGEALQEGIARLVAVADKSDIEEPGGLDADPGLQQRTGRFGSFEEAMKRLRDKKPLRRAPDQAGGEGKGVCSSLPRDRTRGDCMGSPDLAASGRSSPCR